MLWLLLNVFYNILTAGHRGKMEDGPVDTPLKSPSTTLSSIHRIRVAHLASRNYLPEDTHR